MAREWEAYPRAVLESSATYGRRAAAKSIDGIARREHETSVRIEREPDERSPRDQLLGFRRPIHRETIETAGTGDRVHDVQIAMVVEGKSLRPAEAVVEHFDKAVGRDAIDAIARTERRRGDIQPVIRPERQVECGDAWRNGREHRGATVANAQDRAGSIADEERAVRSERDAAGDAQIGGDRRDVAGRVDLVDAAVEPTRDVQRPSGLKASDVGLARSETNGSREPSANDEDRDRPLLPAGSAERHVDVAVRVDGRAVDLVKSSRERGADFNVRGLARNLVNSDRRVSAIETGGNDSRQLGG